MKKVTNLSLLHLVICCCIVFQVSPVVYGMNVADKNGQHLLGLVDQFSFQYPYNPTKIDDCRKLIEAKANVDIVDQEGNSPLLKAVFAGCLVHRSDYVKILIKAHANVDVQNAEGVTPLMIAAKYGNYEICNMLINTGADVTLRNKNDGTALTLALMSDKTHVISLLRDTHKKLLENYQQMLLDTWLQAPAEICVMIPTFVYEE